MSILEFFFLLSHTWYQSESAVVVVIPIRSVQRDQVHVESTENTVGKSHRRLELTLSVFS